MSTFSKSVKAQALVPISLVMVAGCAYLLLMASGRILNENDFAALTSFYLLSNTVGRGTFAVLELELTRIVPRARVEGRSIATAVGTVARGGVLLLGLVWAVSLLTGPWIADTVGGWSGLGLLLVASATLAISSLVRGPLAGDQRFAMFGATLIVESAIYAVGAGVLLFARIEVPLAWTAVLAAAPLCGACLILIEQPVLKTLRRISLRTTRLASPTVPMLLTGSGLYLFSQATWNLGPVIAVSRSSDGVLAAAFAASAVLLRAPVMAFPAVQTLVLPRVAASAPLSKKYALSPALVLAGVALMALWTASSVWLSPPLVKALFAVNETPSKVALAALALSVATGLIIQHTQTRLLALNRTGSVSTSWLVGTAVLVFSAIALPDPILGAAIGQLTAILVVLILQMSNVRRVL